MVTSIITTWISWAICKQEVQQKLKSLFGLLCLWSQIKTTDYDFHKSFQKWLWTRMWTHNLLVIRLVANIINNIWL